MTNKMVDWTSKITEYKICDKIPDIDLSKAATYKMGDKTVEVFDCVEDAIIQSLNGMLLTTMAKSAVVSQLHCVSYWSTSACAEDHLALLKKCFNFEQIKMMVARPDFSMVYDSMSGVQGPYARTC
eukprot:6480741-Amphidinium_carterae.2